MVIGLFVRKSRVQCPLSSGLDMARGSSPRSAFPSTTIKWSKLTSAYLHDFLLQTKFQAGMLTDPGPAGIGLWDGVGP